MKRLLPLLLGLAVSVAQADSNSDYRAGSDFARQIQGQGTGSIQGFKPQESIPGYNANPDETKYYGGVTASPSSNGRRRFIPHSPSDIAQTRTRLVCSPPESARTVLRS